MRCVMRVLGRENHSEQWVLRRVANKSVPHQVSGPLPFVWQGTTPGNKVGSPVLQESEGESVQGK